MSGQSKARSQQKRNAKRAARSKREVAQVRTGLAKNAVAVGTAEDKDTVENQVVVARKPIWLTGLATVVLVVVAVVGFVVVGGGLGIALGVIFAVLAVLGGVITYLLAHAESAVASLADKRASLETQLGRRGKS